MVTGHGLLLAVHAPYKHTTVQCLGEELPLFGGNAQLGCGLVAREIKGHRYLYFWAYEGRSWGTHRTWIYVGPLSSPRTRPRARELLLMYHGRVRREIDRRMSVLLRSATGSV